MDKKTEWIKSVENAANHYLNLNDGGFDGNMKASLARSNYEEQSITFAFETQKWQMNERGAIHGGAISGMFDTAFGIVANFIAGKDEATTTDMNICYIRQFELNDIGEIKVITVKAGRKLIRLRAEFISKETNKLIATASGSWMPL